MILKTDERKIWFTADTHYWHTNITYGPSTWKHKETSTRRFDTVKDMSRHIVEQLNKYIGQDDILFHLGDWSFGGIENIWNFRKQLICKEIHLILGNHDKHIKENRLLPMCSNSFGLIHNSMNYYQNLGLTLPENSKVLSQDLFTKVYDYLEVQVDKHEICLMHYPIDSWNRGFIHLHGHTHSNHPIKDMRLDVGIDNAFKLYGEYRPFDFEDIKKQLKL